MNLTKIDEYFKGFFNVLIENYSFFDIIQECDIDDDEIEEDNYADEIKDALYEFINNWFDDTYRFYITENNEKIIIFYNHLKLNIKYLTTVETIKNFYVNEAINHYLNNSSE